MSLDQIRSVTSSRYWCFSVYPCLIRRPHLIIESENFPSFSSSRSCSYSTSILSFFILLFSILDLVDSPFDLLHFFYFFLFHFVASSFFLHQPYSLSFFLHNSLIHQHSLVLFLLRKQLVACCLCLFFFTFFTYLSDQILFSKQSYHFLCFSFSFLLVLTLFLSFNQQFLNSQLELITTPIAYHIFLSRRFCQTQSSMQSWVSMSTAHLVMA